MRGREHGDRQAAGSNSSPGVDPAPAHPTGCRSGPGLRPAIRRGVFEINGCLKTVREQRCQEDPTWQCSQLHSSASSDPVFKATTGRGRDRDLLLVTILSTTRGQGLPRGCWCELLRTASGGSRPLNEGVGRRSKPFCLGIDSVLFIFFSAKHTVSQYCFLALETFMF